MTMIEIELRDLKQVLDEVVVNDEVTIPVGIFCIGKISGIIWQSRKMWLPLQ